MPTEPVVANDRGTTAIASAIVAGTGILWGLYWIPVRALSGSGLAGAWGTVAITVAALLILSPFAFRRRRQFRVADGFALASFVIGGAAFALYSVGLVYGRVAIIILLYFLTPVWSTLIGRYVMGWPISRLRILAIVVGLAGLLVMLGAGGDVPLPRGAGEWMALAAGFLWSIGTTGIRTRPELPPIAAAFVFALGAVLAALTLALALEPLPTGPLAGGAMKVAGIALLTGGLWWGLSIAALMWATARLEPARVGILLMTEVVVGSASAALFADERLGAVEIAGGSLVVLAAVLEVWPARRRAAAASR